MYLQTTISRNNDIMIFFSCFYQLIYIIEGKLSDSGGFAETPPKLLLNNISYGSYTVKSSATPAKIFKSWARGSQGCAILKKCDNNIKADVGPLLNILIMKKADIILLKDLFFRD